jgi:diguanylate cyclase (GGDEF)-like protein
VTVTSQLAAIVVITRLRRALASARREANHDALTQLPNGKAADRAIAAAIAAGRPVTVALLDLDDFKAVNDRYGHHVGDEVLRVISSRLSAVRRIRMAARLHGDEFLFVVYGDVSAGLAAARAVSRQLAGDIQLASGERLRVRVSIGVAAGGTGSTVHQLCQLADAAMYEAKRKGVEIHAYGPTTARQPAERFSRVSS